MTSIFTAALLGVAGLQASPALVSRQSITTLTTSQIDAFTPYTYFAAAAYCAPSTTLSWTCGDSCANNTGFEPVASGGDSNGIQYWYVGYDPSLDTVIVAHQGTNTTQILALLTDLDIILGGLDSSLFPGLPSDIKVHDGFRNEQSLTASDILSSVQTTISKYGTSSVTLVGHSLGAALSLLDSLYLPLHLPSGTTFQTILYGLPRVGNQAFADYCRYQPAHYTHQQLDRSHPDLT
ncbi:Alpha/Beta hydrolase protein [Lanmaoa asiatica]|nr:Alpha/Beta hydrolase protein [Lanmaoa asiatica]